jgi:hypothetical protein
LACDEIQFPIFTTRRCVLRWSPLTTAMCREPLCPQTGVTSCGTTSCASHQRTLLLLHRSYGLMRQAKTLPLTSVSLISVGLCPAAAGLPAPAGRWPFPTLSLQSLRRCLDPYPAVSSKCSCSLLPWRQRPHLRRHRFGTPKLPLQCNFHREFYFGAAVIPLCSGSHAR